MTIEEKRALGRLACDHCLSLGEYLRRLIASGLAAQDPEAALRVAKFRERHRRQKLLL